MGQMARLEGKRALVTGAASGLGRATAIRLAREGARVAALDIQVQKLEETASEIQTAGGEVLPITTDVSSEPQVEAAVDQAVAAWGGLDAVVGVAGIELYAEGDTAV